MMWGNCFPFNSLRVSQTYTHSCGTDFSRMDKLSSLVMILTLVLLCALPLYCELKPEETLDVDVMGEGGDAPEALRIKRGLPDAPLSRLRQRKQTETGGDLKTVKRKKNAPKARSRDGEQRSLGAASGDQTRKKSGRKQKSKFNANKKSGARKVRNSPRKSVKREMKIERDGACVDDTLTAESRKTYHSLGKRAEGRKGKTGTENKKSVKRDINVNTLNEIKPLARKVEVGTANSLEKKISNATFPVNSSKSIKDDGDDDDKACVDEHGPLKQIKRSENLNQSPSKREGNKPALDYYKALPRKRESFDK